VSIRFESAILGAVFDDEWDDEEGEEDGWDPDDGTPLILHPPLRREEPKPGRNSPCPCGSGKKYKHCCGGGTASPGSHAGAPAF